MRPYKQVRWKGEPNKHGAWHHQIATEVNLSSYIFDVVERQDSYGFPPTLHNQNVFKELFPYAKKYYKWLRDEEEFRSIVHLKESNVIHLANSIVNKEAAKHFLSSDF